MEREVKEAEEVNNVLNLSLQTPCVPVIVRQGRREEGGKWEGGREYDGRTLEWK